MNNLTKYKKKRLTRTNKLIISILLLLTIGVGYSSLVSNLSISGNILVKKYEDQNILFNKIAKLSEEPDSCIYKYTGQVTDSVGVTKTAENVYFNRCEDKRNIIFGGYCWEVIRTTETGGLKILYNGLPENGKCESTRSDFNNIVISGSNKTFSSTTYLYGASYTYDEDNNLFTLENTFTETWNSSTYESLIGKYTCRSEGDSCTNLDRIGEPATDSGAYVDTYYRSSIPYSFITTSYFNSIYLSIASIGYKYNILYPENKSRSLGLYGNSFTYNNNTNTYTLSGTTQMINSLSNADLSNTHYTCFNSTGECEEISYVYLVSSNTLFYLKMSGGKGITDALNDMLNVDNVNANDSSIKGVIDNWYREHLLDYTDKIEDSVYCNNRVIADYKNFNPNGGSVNGNEIITFRNFNNNLDLTCTNLTDQFAVSNNKAKLTYPVALITAEEARNISNPLLIQKSKSYWTLSPNSSSLSWSTTVHYNNLISTDGTINNGTISSYNVGVRPVISLASGTVISGGTGSTTDPWVVQE